ncbi:MAG TPA: hypothetical protein VN958_14245 [Chitinophagaceae bacterium]|nr:hypothetical protein [Chitinophagaceae bacterium]
MPVRKAITEKEGVYFITFTCTNWLPLFNICNAYDAVYTWFDHLKKKTTLYNWLCYYAKSCTRYHCLLQYR